MEEKSAIELLEDDFYDSIEPHFGSDTTAIEIMNAANDSAKLAKSLAIEFIKFYEESSQSYEYWTKHRVECSPKMDGSHIPKIEAVREGLFEIFIKEKYK